MICYQETKMKSLSAISFTIKSDYCEKFLLALYLTGIAASVYIYSSYGTQVTPKGNPIENIMFAMPLLLLIISMFIRYNCEVIEINRSQMSHFKIRVPIIIFSSSAKSFRRSKKLIKSVELGDITYVNCYEDSGGSKFEVKTIKDTLIFSMKDRGKVLIRILKDQDVDVKNYSELS